MKIQEHLQQKVTIIEHFKVFTCYCQESAGGIRNSCVRRHSEFQFWFRRNWMACSMWGRWRKTFWVCSPDLEWNDAWKVGFMFPFIIYEEFTKSQLKVCEGYNTHTCVLYRFRISNETPLFYVPVATNISNSHESNGGSFASETFLHYRIWIAPKKNIK